MLSCKNVCKNSADTCDKNVCHPRKNVRVENKSYKLVVTIFVKLRGELVLRLVTKKYAIFVKMCGM